MAQLNYLQEPKNDPNAKSIADYVMPTPQPMKASPVRATLPIPQTPAKATVQPQGFHQVNYAPPMNVPNVSMPDVNVQPLLGQKPNILPDVTMPNNPSNTAAAAPVSSMSIADKIGLVQTLANKLDPVKRMTNAFDGAIGKLGAPFADVAANTIAGAAGLQRPDSQGMLDSAVKYDAAVNKPLLPAGAVQSGIKNALQNGLGWTPVNVQLASAPATKPAPTAAPKATPAVSAPAKTEPTIAQNTQAKPTTTSTGVPKPSKPAKAGKPSANPAVQPQAQAPVDGDPYAAYKARTGIDLSNTSFAPVPSYVEKVNQTQGMDFQNGKPANTDGSAVVPVESQEQFNQRWALINDFYNSPEGQAVIAARQQGDVVEVQRGDNTSYTDLRNGGEKGIQDYIANQAAKDSALAKSPTDGMNNRELNQLDLLKPKLTSETALAEANIRENGATGRTLINEAGADRRFDSSEKELNAIKAGVQKDLLSNDPAVVAKAKERWQAIQSIVPAKYDAKSIRNYVDGVPDSEDLIIYNQATGQQVTPSNTKQNAVAKPSLSQFMAKAKLANPDYSDAELRTIYTEKYGK